MKKILNSPSSYVDQALEGMALACPAEYRQVGASGRVIARRHAKEGGKVGLASGGGFGHLPLFAGYVGTGLLDSCAVGDVFAGPSLDDVTEALRAANFGAGVLSVIGNYGGDRKVFGMATETLEEEGIATETVIVADDVASAPPEIAGAGAGTASTTVRIVEIAPGPSPRGPHVHDGFEEVIHVLDGHGRFRSEGGATEIGPGDTVIVPPGERHATENTGDGTLRLVCTFPVADIRPGTREFASWDDA